MYGTMIPGITIPGTTIPGIMVPGITDLITITHTTITVLHTIILPDRLRVMTAEWPITDLTAVSTAVVGTGI